jgi:hypothetical protein
MGYAISDALSYTDNRRRRARRTKRIVVMSLIVVVVCIATVVAVHWAPWRTGRFADPAKVELPPPTETDALRVWANDPAAGGKLVSFTDATTALLDQESNAERCIEFASATLPSIGSPFELWQAAARAPDQPTAEMAISHLDATTRFLASCTRNAGDQVQQDHDELAFTHDVLKRRLSQIR